MSKKIVAVNASPRKGWNTDTLVTEAAKGAEAAGAVIQKFDLYRLEKFTGCISCFGCKKEKFKGHCICRDGLTPVLDAIREADGIAHPYVYGRSEKDRRREPGEIGFHSIRGGTIVGQHEVRFLGQDEEISIRHEAYSKRVFAVGALRAVQFLLTKENGLYSMEDLVSELLN